MPFGSREVTIDSGLLTISVAGYSATCAGEEESATFRVKENVPAASGIPEIVPVAGAIPKPVGNEPLLMLQV